MSAYTDLLRKVADLIDLHELPAESVTVGMFATPTVAATVSGETERDLWRRALGGTWTATTRGRYHSASGKDTLLPAAHVFIYFTTGPEPAAVEVPLAAVA